MGRSAVSRCGSAGDSVFEPGTKRSFDFALMATGVAGASWQRVDTGVGSRSAQASDGSGGWSRGAGCGFFGGARLSLVGAHMVFVDGGGGRSASGCGGL